MIKRECPGLGCELMSDLDSTLVAKINTALAQTGERERY